MLPIGFHRCDAQVKTDKCPIIDTRRTPKCDGKNFRLCGTPRYTKAECTLRSRKCPLRLRSRLSLNEALAIPTMARRQGSHIYEFEHNFVSLVEYIEMLDPRLSVTSKSIVLSCLIFGASVARNSNIISALCVKIFLKASRTTIMVGGRIAAILSAILLIYQSFRVYYAAIACKQTANRQQQCLKRQRQSKQWSPLNRWSTEHTIASIHI